MEKRERKWIVEVKDDVEVEVPANLKKEEKVE